MHFTRALHLQNWCEDTRCRVAFPQLVRKLISASCSPQRIEFPAFEEVQQRGWDGIVEAADGNSLVPAGLSLWELSTEAGIAKKAEADLAKRASDPLGFDKAKATVVFATPRRWPNRRNRREWENEQRTAGGWRDVRVIDAGDLEKWLENTPSVDWWLAHILGLRPTGATDFARHWASLSALAKPILQPTVFLASRAPAVEKLDRWIAEKASALSIEATTPGEAVDFIAAWLAERQFIEARALLVESREAWRALAGPGSPLLLVSHPMLKLEAEVVSEAVLHGHHVALPSNDGSGEILSVPKVRQHHLHEALIACGFGFEQAARHARETGGNLGVLKRRLAAAAGSTPSWATPPSATEIAPLVLAGSWNESKEGDTEIIAALTGKESPQIASLVRRWSKAEDAPLIQKGHQWHFTSREESWSLLSKQLDPQQLKKFEEIAASVLVDPDPRYGLPMSERAYAALRRQVPKQSWEMREGVAETIALFGRGEAHEQLLAERIVRRVLQGAEWQCWASISMQLPLLAEAAPDAFLTAAEADLASPEPALLRLFHEEDKSAWMATHPHTGLLWAFEVLIWSPDYISRASLCLARLSRLDPGGKLGNRPGGSLRDTFLPWAPHTGADSNQRLQVLDHLLAKEPETTWNLLFAFLPRQDGSTNPRIRPRWRDWAEYDIREVSHAEYVEQVYAIADRILAFANGKNDCWPLLIEKLERFPDKHTELLLQRLRKLTPEDMGGPKAIAFWNQLRAKIAWHRRCENESWALRKKITDAIAEITKRFQPEDPLELNTWLFLPGSLLEFYEEERNHDSSRERLEAAQIAALRAIFSSSGLDGLRTLVARTGHSAAEGFHVAEENIFCDDPAILPPSLIDSDDNWRSFALGYAAGRFKTGSWTWLRGLGVSSWEPNQAGWLSRALPFEPTTWKWFEELGSPFCRAYWRQVIPWPGTLTQSELEEATLSLITEDRIHSTLDLLHSAHFQNKPVSHSLIAQGLRAFLVTKERPNTPEEARQTAWSIRELMECLTSNPELPLEQLAQLEWSLLKILDAQQYSPKALLDSMEQSPEFFAEVVSAAYTKPAENEDDWTARRENAIELLRSWRRLPGQNQDGSIASESLNNWIEQARNECSSRECGSVGDLVIGKILALSPSENDGSWPLIPVRDCIEKFASDRIEQGFNSGTINKRGITTHALGEGGDQERELATRFREYADSSKFRWPRTARQLSDLATFYQNDARRYDERALGE